MSSRVTIIRQSDDPLSDHPQFDGGIVVEKTSLEGDRADRRAEARWLAEARSSIVVRLLGVDADPTTIRTSFGGQLTLRTDRPRPNEAAQLFLALARGLAELHDRGLVHGKLTLDHVIISPAGQILLCSPSGTETDPSVDLIAFGDLVERVLRRWDEEGVTVDRRPQWDRIPERLKAGDDRLSAHRIARWFAPLVIPQEAPIAPPSRSARWRSGLLALTGFLALTIGGIAVRPLLDSTQSTAENETGPEVDVDGSRYRIRVDGTARDSVAIGPAGCSGARLAYLETATGTIWAFDDVEDAGTGRAVASAPGATTIEFRPEDDGCELWATGPAGSARVPLTGAG